MNEPALNSRVLLGEVEAIESLDERILDDWLEILALSDLISKFSNGCHSRINGRTFG